VREEVRKSNKNKKMKIEDSEDEKPELEQETCQRCFLNLNNQRKKCHLCKNQFHNNCSRLRGIVKDFKFYCFDCYARKF